MNKNSVLAEIQNERWAMSESCINAFIKKADAVDFSKVDPKAFVSDEACESNSELSIYSRSGHSAVIRVSGMLLKSKPCWFAWADIVATEFDTIKTAISRGIGDDSVDEIVLIIESGGGQVGGTKELADFIYKSDMNDKPIRAFIQDMGASGAYWLASSCRDITMNHNGQAGSIGVYTVMEDTSKRFEEAGVKVHVIKNGEHKGDFTDGTEITSSQIEAEQEIIDGLALSFHESVARGRDMDLEEVQELGTGRVWLSSQAQEIGLIDDINSLDNYLNGVSDDTLISHGGNIMATKKEAVAEEIESVDVEAIKNEGVAQGQAQAVNLLKELKASFPENEKFAIEQFEAGATVDAAKLAYNDVLLNEVKELKASNLELEEKANTTASTGTDAVESNVSAQGKKSDAEIVEDYKKEHNCSYTEAYRALSIQKRKG